MNNNHGDMSSEILREEERESLPFGISSQDKSPWRALSSTRLKRIPPTPAKSIGTAGSFTLESWAKSTIVANPTAEWGPTQESATTTWPWNPSRQGKNSLSTTRCKTIKYKTSQLSACAGQLPAGKRSQDGGTYQKIRKRSMRVSCLTIYSRLSPKNTMLEEWFYLFLMYWI